MTELLEMQNPWLLPAFPARRRPQRISAKLRNRLLNLSLCCSAVFLLLIFPVLLSQSLSDSRAVLGWRLLVVSGNAMEPSIRSGALVLARETPFERLKEGDVIIYNTSAGHLKTRRVVSLQPSGATTKGDSAILPDASPVTPDSYRCRVRKVFNGFSKITRVFE